MNTTSMWSSISSGVTATVNQCVRPVSQPASYATEGQTFDIMQASVQVFERRKPQFYRTILRAGLQKEVAASVAHKGVFPLGMLNARRDRFSLKIIV